MIKIIQLFVLTALLLACNSNDPTRDSENPPLKLFIKVPLKVKNGYTINPISNDTIRPIVNSIGDTIETGKPIAVQFKKVKTESVEKREYRDLGSPDVIQYEPSIKKVTASNTYEKIIDRSSIKKIPLGSSTQKEAIQNALGNSIVTGREIKIKAEVKKAINTPRTRVDPAKFQENAHLNIKFLDVDQGLTSSYIFAVTEDSLGQLYFGTYGNGLMIYDGHSVQSFTTLEGLTSNLIRNLFTDSKGTLWIGYEAGGLGKYDGESFTTYTTSNGFLGDNVYDILEDKNGNIWCATNNGVSKFDGKHFTHYSQKEGLSSRVTWSICEDSKGRIWIGNDDGIVSCFDGSTFSEYGEEQGIESGKASILSILEDSDGSIWISAMNSGVFRISGNTVCQFSPKQGFAGTIITSITEDQNRNLWFTSYGQGIIKFDGSSFYHYSDENGLNRMAYWIMHIDNAGNLWFGSEGGGITTIQEKSFQHLTAENTLKGLPIWAMDQGENNTLWLSNLGYGLIQKQGESLSYFSNEQNLSSNNILAIKSDSKENLWLGHWGAGVDLIQQGKITNFNEENGLGTNHIFSIIEDKKEAIWFATASGGAIKFDGDYFYHLSEEQGLGKKNVRTIFEDSKGIIWIGTDGAGLVKFDGKTITHFSEKEGLISNFVRCIEEDKMGNIWVGTNLGGLSIFTGKEFIQIEAEHGLTNNNIRTINKTSDNLFIIGTEKGLNLIQLSKNEQKSIRVELATYQKNDGLRGIDFLLNTSLIDNENRIWWSTGKALSSAKLSDLLIPKTTPRSIITALDINQKKYDYAVSNESLNYTKTPLLKNIPEDAILEHSQNHLTFHFSGIDWKSPDQVRYSYRINDENWSIPSAELKADYRNLSSGKHTFEVRSIGNNFKWSHSDLISFEILSPWWKRWWAYIIYILLILAAIYGVYRYQLKRQLAIGEADRLREMDRLKTEFFTNISHEFRTPLTIITGLKDRLETNYRTRKDGAFQKNVDVLHKNGDQLLGLVNQLLDISKLEQGMMHLNIKEIEVYSTLKYELSSYGSTADQKKIKLELNCIQTELTTLADEKALLSIFHNLLGNALKFTQNGTITVGIKAKDDSTVQISIRDTGIGIAEDNLPQIFDRFYQVDNSDTKEYQGSGIGLSHVQKLIELQAATIEVDSELGLGTTFIMDFPRGKDVKTLNSVPDDLNNSSELNSTNDLQEDDSRPKLLIVEDNDDMRYFISTILEDEYSISTAVDGIEGLAIAQKLVPDFIISDWMMPKMTGPEMLQELKANVSTSHIPMMLLTARADQDSKIKGYQHGADAYLIKPFESEELRVRIKVLIDAKKRLQDFYSSVETSELPESENRPTIEDAFILKTLDFVKHNLSDSDLSGDQIAEQHYLSRSQFARKLRTLTGKSVTEFIRNLRMEEAKRLLTEQKLNVSEIAYEIGFSDPAYFTRVFTKETGIPPSNWKENGQ